jgi:hypothetical protein
MAAAAVSTTKATISAAYAPIGRRLIARIAATARTNFSRASNRWIGESRGMERSRSS